MPSFLRRQPPSTPSAPPTFDAEANGAEPRNDPGEEATAPTASAPPDEAPRTSCEGTQDKEHGADASWRASASGCIRGVRSWLTDSVWPGMGLFGESYVLFSLGTLEPLWKQIYPECWGNEELNIEPTCSEHLRHSLSYSVVLGVIGGMVLFGLVAARIGRRRGSLSTALIMATGATGLTLLGFAYAARARHGQPDNPTGFLTGLSVLLFFFGVGVGGEYPLSASSASERTMEAEAGQETPHGGAAAGPSEKQRHRGRAVQLVFTMQGMGIFFNTIFLSFLLAVTGQTGRDNAPYDTEILRAVSNGVYAVGAAILWYVFVSRYRYLRESAAWEEDRAQRTRLTRNQPAAMETVRRLSRGVPPGAAAPPPDSSTTEYQNLADGRACGEGLSKTPPRSMTTRSVSSVSSRSAPTEGPGPSSAVEESHDPMALDDLPSETDLKDIQTKPVWLLMQHFGVRLAGVSLCWMLWDVAFYGNKLFQSTFLLALTGEDTTTLLGLSLAATLNALVALCGYFGAAMLLDRVGRFWLQLVGFLFTGVLFVAVGLTYDRLSTDLLVVLYLGSSFFGQLGPNATTFLLPAEAFPTEVRTLCHGLAAAAGKAGALIASIVFGRVEVLDRFLLSGYTSLAACLITYWAVPESNGLDLYELDRKWRLILDGRKAEYVGQASDPRYLSRHERFRSNRRRRRRRQQQDQPQQSGVHVADGFVGED